ncbi:MAG: hypothetical protein AABX04_08400, partial [Nanoarchaeota archaeon]
LIPNVYDPKSLNRYMFERGNPYGKTDPTGHKPESHTAGPDPFGMLKSAGEFISYNIGYAILMSRTSDESLKTTLKNHRNEGNKAIIKDFLSAASGGMPLGDDVQPEGEIFAGSGLYVESDPSCEFLCLRKTDITKFQSDHQNIYEMDKVAVQSRNAGSNLIIQNIIQKYAGGGLSQKQLQKVQSGGSAKTKEGSTITSVTLNSQTVIVKITPVKPTNPKTKKR